MVGSSEAQAIAYGLETAAQRGKEIVAAEEQNSRDRYALHADQNAMEQS